MIVGSYLIIIPRSKSKVGELNIGGLHMLGIFPVATEEMHEWVIK